MSTIKTRMGDGYTVEMTRDELRDDLLAGSADASKKGKIPQLDSGDLEYLHEMFVSPRRVWAVERGHEAVVTKDGSSNTVSYTHLRAHETRHDLVCRLLLEKKKKKKKT